MSKANSNDLYRTSHRLGRHVRHTSHREGYRRGGLRRRLKNWLRSVFKREAHGRHQNHSHGNFPTQIVPGVSPYCIIPEKCRGCEHCKKVCRFGAISGSYKQAHTIDSAKCKQCGNCVEVCKYGAIKAIT